MSDFSDLWVTWRAPRDRTDPDLKMPRVNVSAIEVLEANLVSAKHREEQIMPVFDINQTLGIFGRDRFIFYSGVLEELCELLKVTAVPLISGDQLSVIQKKFVPVLTDYIRTNYSHQDQKLIFNNLTIYAQTGMSVLKFSPKKNHKPIRIPSAELNSLERKKILDDVIPEILNKYSKDPRFDLLPKEFQPPNKSVNRRIRSAPLYTQRNSRVSLEVSIFGIHEGEKKILLKEEVKANPALEELANEITNDSGTFLASKGLAIKANRGGFTVDFRKFDKEIVVYYYLASLTPWSKNLTLVGIGDSFGECGNDAAFAEACSLVYDVSENHQNPENALEVIQLIRKYT